MSVDTYGELTNSLTCSQVVEKLQQNVNIEVVGEDFNEVMGKMSGFCDFDYTLPSGKIEKRSLFVLEKCGDTFNEEIDSILGNSFTHLSIGNSKNSSLIMRDILQTLGGGVLIPNDCTPTDSDSYFSVVS